MIRRFFYHVFWNFYDYLGTFSVCGLAILTLLLLLLQVCLWIFPDRSGLAEAVFVVPALLVLAVGLAMLAPFSAKAARGEPSRMPDLWSGIRTRTGVALKTVLVFFLVDGVAVVNVAFYLSIGGHREGETWGTVATMFGAALGWFVLGSLLALLPAVALVGEKGRLPLKAWVRRMMLLLALAPGMWIVAAVLLLLVVLIGLWTRVGLIYILPCLACFSCTAGWLTLQHAELLEKAREILGPGKRVREYRKKAFELGEEWEHRQPRRTFRELIKPWE